MVIGAVSLAPGSQDILVGMGFLRQFKLGMIMVKNSVVLIDEEELEQIEHKQRKDEEAATAAQSPRVSPDPPKI